MNKRYAALTSIALGLLAAGAAHAQLLSFSPSSVSLYAQSGTTSSGTQTINVTSSDGTTVIPFNVAPNSAWINVPTAPSGGWKTPATVTVSVNPGQLALGKSVGMLNFSGSGFFQTVEIDVTVSTIGVQLPVTGGQSSVLNLGSYQAGSAVFPADPSSLFVTGDITNLTITQPSADTWYTYSPPQPFGTPPSLPIQIRLVRSVVATLSPGTYTSNLTLAPENSGPTVTIPITLTVKASPLVTVAPATLVFNWQRNGANQTQQMITFQSNAAQPISLSLSPGVSWITLPNTSPTIPANGSVQVPVQVQQLAGDAQPMGANFGSIQVTIPAGGALFDNSTTSKSVLVQLNVSSAPVMFLPSTPLSFTSQFGSSTASPASYTLNPTTSGPAMTYTVAASTASWLTISPPPGSPLSTDGGSFTVTSNPTGMLPGTYSTTVSVTPQANGSGQGALTVPVTMTVTFPNALQTNIPANPQVCSGQPCMIFQYQTGQATPASQTVNVTTVTGAPLRFVITPPAATATWIQVSGALTGITDVSSFTVSIVPSGIGTLTGVQDATINIAAYDLVTSALVNSVSIDVKLYISAQQELVVSSTSPAISALSPIQLTTWPYSSKYPNNDQLPVNVYLFSSQPVSEELTGVAIQQSVSNQSLYSDWLLVNNPASGTPTSFTVGAIRDTVKMPVGTYYGAITISAAPPANSTAPVADSPLSIPVQFIVNAAKGSASCYPSTTSCSLSFTQTKGSPAPASQVVQVTTDGTAAFPFTPVVNTGLNNWLTLGSITGQTPGSFSVGVDASNLAIGTWHGAIYINIPNASPNLDGTPLRIPVTFQVNGGAICAGSCTSPQGALTFTQVIGGAAPAPQAVPVVSTPSSVNYTVAQAVTTPAGGTWLAASISAGGGVTPGTVSVSVTPGSLGPGTYTGTVTIASPGATNSPIAIPVSLVVQQATISAPTTTLQFGQLAGGPAPTAQTIAVTSTPGPVSFSVSTSTGNNVPWLSATVGSTGATGTTPANVQVSVNSGLLAAGQYSGVVTITAAGATGSPIYVQVLLNVGAAVTLTSSQASLTFGATVGQAATPQTIQLTSSASTSYTATTSTTDHGTWLTVSPASGTAGATPVTLTVSANTQNLAVGNYTGTVTISSPSSVNPLTVGVTLAVTAVPIPVVTAVANAASWVAGALSPGENIVIGGTGIGPTPLVQVTQLTPAGKFPTTLGNTQVFFDGIAAPIIYASATQTSVMVPYGVAGRTATSIQVVYSGAQSVPVSYNVAAAAPGIYAQNSRGFGPGSIINQDGTVNGPNNPAPKGTVVAIYMTGEGVTNPGSTDGAIANTTGNPLNKPILGVTASVAGLSANVLYAGSAPGILYGVMQVNVAVPSGAPSGAQAVVVNVGNYATPSGVTLAVQ